MIQKVHIQGFKTAVDVTLELGQLNVLIGANGSGKSNLLEALGVLSCAAAGRVDYRDLQHRGVRLGTPVLYKSAFRAQKRIIEHITLEAASETARYRVSLGNPSQGGSVVWSYATELLCEGERILGERTPEGSFLVGRSREGSGEAPVRQPADPGERDGLARLVRGMHGRGPLAELLEWLTSFAIYSPCTPILRGRIADPDGAEPLGLQGGGLSACANNMRVTPALWQRVQEEAFSVIDWAREARLDASSDWAAMQGAAPPSDILLKLKDRHLIEELAWVSQREANEGALYALFLFLLLLNPDAPQIFAIDNVDHSLNPRLVVALIERVQQILLGEPNRPQVLLTTQNPAVLDALDLENDRVRLFTVGRERPSGATFVRRFLPDEAIKEVEKKRMPLSYLWTSGFIGGMPPL